MINLSFIFGRSNRVVENQKEKKWFLTLKSKICTLNSIYISTVIEISLAKSYSQL